MKNQEFIHRKRDHLQIALRAESQATASAGFESVALIHDSLPDLNLQDIDLSSSFLGQKLATPFFVAAMTAGHSDAEAINGRLAKHAALRGWAFGLGSQRRELDSSFADQASHQLKKNYPGLQVISNLGIAQLVEIHSHGDWNRLNEVIAKTQAKVIAVHLNPLQEAIQMEGTPQFKGGLQALEALRKHCSARLVIKETGSGMSESFLQRILPLSPFAIDVSGVGGTHWGQVEGLRAPEDSFTAVLGKTFQSWGVSTVQSILNAKKVFTGTPTEIWASGGVRSGLDAAKCFALGANRVGFAKPALAAAVQSDAEVDQWMMLVEKELKTALFCTNSANLSELNPTKIISVTAGAQHG